NRVSRGFQSCHDEDLKSAGRLHSAHDVFRDFDTLRSRGFSNISIDLIAGLPRQRASVWTANLDWVERLLPEHVSVYILDAEDGSAWGQNCDDLPSEEVFASFYLEAAERLANAVYARY